MFNALKGESLTRETHLEKQEIYFSADVASKNVTHALCFCIDCRSLLSFEYGKACMKDLSFWREWFRFLSSQKKMSLFVQINLPYFICSSRAFRHFSITRSLSSVSVDDNVLRWRFPEENGALECLIGQSAKWSLSRSWWSLSDSFVVTLNPKRRFLEWVIRVFLFWL
jgi:hypothetical protein